ncbi:ABC transporter substrate-binding protein [Spongorhabdus nitratireducens]
MLYRCCCLILGTLLCLVVSACEQRDWKKSDRILRMPHPLEFGGADNLDPLSPYRFWQVNLMLYDQLLRLEHDGQISPGLATHWSSNPEGTVWNFKLRQNVIFHNRKPFTSEDALYSLKRVKDPELASPASAVLALISEIKAPTPYTLKIQLSSPHHDFPLLLTDYRIRIIPAGSSAHIARSGIGTGPFQLVSLDPEGKTVLTAFPEYWDGKPALSGVELYCIPDSQARVQALLAGQIDWLDAVSARQQPLFHQQQQLRLQSIPCGEWRGIIFRIDKPPFNDARVRQALKIATDRLTIMELVSGKEGGQISCDNPVWSGDGYHYSSTCRKNIQQARNLLAEAGYPDGIEFELHTCDIEPEFIPLAEAYQQQVQEAGVRVIIRRIPSDSYWQSVWMKVPAMTTRWGQRHADQVLNELFRSGAPWNESGYRNSAFDQLLDAARAEADSSKRHQLYSQLQQILQDDGGVYLPYFPNYIRVTSQQLVNVPATETKIIHWHRIGKS